MDTEGKLAEYVKELLGTHNCITIPGLGSFIYRDSPASANAFSMEIKPSGRTIFFNNAIVADDGVLINRIKEQEGLSYNQALGYVNEVAGTIRVGLQSNRSVSFAPLGNFFLNAEGHIFFLPSANLNLSQETYGLPTLKLADNESSKTKEVEEKVTEFVATSQVNEIEYDEAEIVHLDETHHHKSRGIFFKAAAVFVVVTLAAAGIYFGSQFFQSTNKQLKQASVVTAEKPAPVPEIQTEHQVISAPADNIESVTEHLIVIENTASTVSQEEHLKQLTGQHGNFYALGGMYMDENLAKMECIQWNKNHVNAAIYKPEGSSLFKVILARFESEELASNFMATLPEFTGANVSVRQLDLIK